MENLEINKFIPKSWGYESFVVNDKDHNICGKELFVKKGFSSSLHYHRNKTEAFRLISGGVRLFYSWDDCLKDGQIDYSLLNVQDLQPGDSFYIPVGLRHKFYGMLDSIIMEVSNYSEDSDSIRLAY
ncbi:MAG: cupin domain-containing protein [Nitrososphaerales archaeon]